MAVTTTEVERILPLGATLGEGPLWLDDALWFVDIKKHQVHRLTPTTGNHQFWQAPAQVGWVQPTADGGMIAGLQTGLHRFDPVDGSFTPLLVVEPDAPGNRLTIPASILPDGSGSGRWTMPRATRPGRIYVPTRGGVAPLVDGIVITNGPAVSPGRLHAVPLRHAGGHDHTPAR